MKKSLLIAIMLVAMVLPLFANAQGEAAAGTFAPSSEIEWICTSKPGGGSDIYTRMISEIMKNEGLVSQNFLINYKTDGGGEVGRLYVATTQGGDKPNHTLLTFNSGDLMPMCLNTDQRLENFTPIAVMAVDKQLLFIGEHTQYKSFQEVIDACNAGKRIVIGGSKGDDIATYEALLAELGFTEAQLAYITYDATSGAITDLLGGHVDLCMSKPAAASQYVEAGRMIPILALSKTRFTGNLADAPKLSEVGDYDDVEVPVWRGVVGPKNMSAEAARFYSDVLKKVSESATWQNDYIAKNGLIAQYMDCDEAAAFMAEYQADYLKKIGKDK